MSWAGRRKGLYIGTTSIILLVIVGGIGYLFFARPPTCTDLVQNGTETGVDCGGACTRICKEDARKPVILWTRSFLVVPGVYTVAAYFQNNNKTGYVREAHYLFQLRDAGNNVIAERQGVTAIPPGKISVVVESNIGTGNSIPVRAFFMFTDETMHWEKGEAPQLLVVQEPLEVEARRQSVTVTNTSDKELFNLPVGVVLFDAQDTAIAASKSSIARLQRDGKETVIFTWPSPVVGIPVRAEVTVLTMPL